MSHRTLLLFDPQSHPQSWTERMLPGEYAVLYSFQPTGHEDGSAERASGPTCTICSTLPEAEAHAKTQVELHPSLRCRVYGTEGLGGPPIRELLGPEYREENQISARFRRWCGSVLFLGGFGLIGLDALTDFRLSWPATIGARALPVGLVLLATEIVIVWESKRKASSPSEAG